MTRLDAATAEAPWRGALPFGDAPPFEVFFSALAMDIVGVLIIARRLNHWHVE
jgi:hypothetical protein